MASVAAVEGQCLDAQLKESLPGGKGGVMPSEDERSSDEVDRLAAAALRASEWKSGIHTDSCHQVARPALVAKTVSTASQGKGEEGKFETDATERV